MRFITLDVFRGMTVFLMIVVNTPGSGAMPYSPLLHAEWHGCTLTDLVFPAFLFAVGNAISFSTRNKSLRRILKRTVLIFVIGFLLTWLATIYINGNWHVSMAPFSQTRLLAVLQRIALVYAAAAIMALYLSDKAVFFTSLVLLLGYWLILLLSGTPGMEYSITGNAVRALDLRWIGENHMYKEKGIVFDPEGLLSTLPAIVNVTCGYLVGRFIQRKGKTFECIALLLVAGNLMLLGAWLWSLQFPLNKKLWTSSFVLLTSGIAVIVTALLFYVYEIRKWRTGTFFFSVFGKNPLFIYILATLLGICFSIPAGKGSTAYEYINIHIFQALAPGPMGSLLFAIAFTLICWVVGLWLDKRKIYIRV